MVNKSNITSPKPAQQIKVEPSVAMVKDLLAIILMGMLFTSLVKLLELPNPMGKINIGTLCPLSQLK